MIVETVHWDGAPVSIRPAPERVEGEHEFIVTVRFRVADPDQPGVLLDHENLRSVSAPSCHWCWATTDNGEPCPGHPG